MVLRQDSLRFELGRTGWCMRTSRASRFSYSTDQYTIRGRIKVNTPEPAAPVRAASASRARGVARSGPRVAQARRKLEQRNQDEEPLGDPRDAGSSGPASSITTLSQSRMSMSRVRGPMRISRVLSRPSARLHPVELRPACRAGGSAERTSPTAFRYSGWSATYIGPGFVDAGEPHRAAQRARACLQPRRRASSLSPILEPRAMKYR